MFPLTILCLQMSGSTLKQQDSNQLIGSASSAYLSTSIKIKNNSHNCRILSFCLPMQRIPIFYMILWRNYLIHKIYMFGVYF